jgi:hypothetical protein
MQSISTRASNPRKSYDFYEPYKALTSLAGEAAESFFAPVMISKDMRYAATVFGKCQGLIGEKDGN